MSAPPFIVGGFFTALIGIISDNLKLRGPFVILCALVGVAGYSILYAAPVNKPGLSYTGTFLAAIGVFPIVPVLVAWGGGSAGGDIKRGVSIAMGIGVANLGGLVDNWSLSKPELTPIFRICSSFIYRTQDAPRFHIGHGTVIGSLLLV
jgi:hypothetical protein